MKGKVQYWPFSYSNLIYAKRDAPICALVILTTLLHIDIQHPTSQFYHLFLCSSFVKLPLLQKIAESTEWRWERSIYKHTLKWKFYLKSGTLLLSCLTDRSSYEPFWLKGQNIWSNLEILNYNIFQNLALWAILSPKMKNMCSAF